MKSKNICIVVLHPSSLTCKRMYLIYQITQKSHNVVAILSKLISI